MIKELICMAVAAVFVIGGMIVIYGLIARLFLWVAGVNI